MARTTQPGYVNRNGQEVLGPTGQAGTDHGQSIYVLRCQRCSAVYGANGSDIALRRCPSCSGGRAGFEVSEVDIVEAAEAKPSRNRNPNWTRDELILALELYQRKPTADDRDPEVQELSALLNRFWAAANLALPTLRNAVGVSMKLGNFQALDPNYTASGRKGLEKGGRLEKEVWAELASEPARVRAIAAAIRAAIEQAPELLRMVSGDEQADEDAPEGAVLTRLHRFRERDGKLARKKKAQVLEANGRLVCEACEFDFADAYGPRGHGYIEVHHTKALETLEAGARTKLSELALLCANCHRIVHAKRPWLSMSELRSLVVAHGRGEPLAQP